MRIAAVKLKNNKKFTIRDYKTFNEIADVERMLNEKIDENWDEFFLYSNDNEELVMLVRKDNQLLPVPKYLTVGNLIEWLDRNYSGWARFVIVSDYYPKMKYNECTVGMLVKQGSVKSSETNATNKLRLILEATDDQIVVNEEGEKRTYNFKHRKTRFFMEVISDGFDPNSFAEIFGDVEGEELKEENA